MTHAETFQPAETTRPAAARVVVLGLDMGDGGLIRTWARQGRLPVLASLAASGAWLDLESPARVLHTSTWPTFATGVLPGRHGVYYPYQPRPGHQLARFIEPDQYGVPTFWQIAAAAGRRPLVYDVPETFPEPGVERTIFDWGTWARYGKPDARPRALLREMKARFGPYPLGYEAKRLGLSLPVDLEHRLRASVRYKAATMRWLLERGDWDFAAVAFCETHPAGHYLWPAGALPSAAGDDAAFDSLFRVYAAVDEAIGELCAAAAGSMTIVTSGDGVRPNRCGWHLLPRVLERLGYTVPHGGAGAAGPPPPPSTVARLHSLVPASARRAVTSALPWWVRDRLGVWLQTRHIDWSRTRAFALPTDLEGCIRLNVRGREPLGIVEPGAQYEDLCAEIRLRLLELENPATNAPAVREVWIRNDVFPGPRQEHLPDLVVTWADDAEIEAVASTRAGTVAGRNPDPRTGTHSTAGFAIAAGPGIAAASGQARLVDLAPTILERLGVAAPLLDGTPIRWPTPDATAQESAMELRP